jgi:hypothetical protein
VTVAAVRRNDAKQKAGASQTPARIWDFITGLMTTGREISFLKCPIFFGVAKRK